MREIKEVIVVEGKTDTAVIKRLFHADTIETDGSRVDDQTLELIKEAHKKRGIIILTDPDYPGMRIRQKVMDAVPHAKHAFVERKDATGKHKLGIAEAREEAIIKALEDVVTFEKNQETLSWQDFIDLDIIGDKNKRLQVYQLFHLGYGNAKTLFKRLNMIKATKEDVLQKLNNVEE